MDQKTAYEEAGRVHRHFLSWRHAAFAGYLVALYGVVSLAANLWAKHPSAVVALLFLASPLGIALAIIDDRTRELYNAAQQAAMAMEAGEPGDLYKRLTAAPRTQDRGRPGPHTRIIQAAYWGYTLVMIIAASYLWAEM